jgi:multidrug efflux pump subunit AcrA (membrane-fusion protein)
VRVEIDNKSPDFKLLRPGMNSTCTFISANKENVLSVESDAINTDDQGQSYVTIATGGKVAPEDPTTNMPVDPTVFVGIKTERRTVQTGLVGDDNTEITGGLQAGEKIVVSTVASSSQTDAASSQSGSSPFGGRPTPPKERKK